MASQADADSSGSLQELKEVILDLDWELSDRSLDRLSSVIVPLKREWSARKPYLVCLKIIDNVGHYIKKAKHKAYPEAVKLLSSVFATLEKIDSDDSLTENDRVKLVRVELEKYNGLKSEITGKRKTASSDSEGVSVSPPAEGEPKAEAGDEKEIVLTRVDDQSFPEAEQLLDEFFADDTPASPAGEEEEVKPRVAAEPEEKEEAVEFELGGQDSNKKIANIFGATEDELEARVGEKLGMPDEKSADSDKKLESIISQFSQEITSVITDELRKAVREEITRAQQEE